MAQTLQSISSISYIVAIVCFLAAVFLWFYLKIPMVIGYLTGRLQRNAVARIREANEKGGEKSYKTGKINRERGKLTEEIENKSKPQIKPTEPMDEGPVTDVLDENKVEDTQIDATAYMGTNTTEMLEDKNSTAPLEKQKEICTAPYTPKELEMLDAVELIHTDEVIE